MRLFLEVLTWHGHGFLYRFKGNEGRERRYAAQTDHEAAVRSKDILFQNYDFYSVLISLLKM